MFTNVILLSLLTIIYGINGEDGNREQNAFNFLDAPTQHEDLNFFKTPRAIRTPFRNTEIMTARGFGKRNGESEQDDNGIDRQDVLSDYGIVEDKVQRSSFFPYLQELLKLPRRPEPSGISAPIRNHRLQLRDGPLKFRLNDGNLRIGRGFGKRSFFIDTPAELDGRGSNSFDSADVLKALSQLKAKDGNKEEA